MPSSLQARSTRSAISPRLAMRIFETMTPALFDDDEGLAVFDGASVLDEDFGDLAGLRRRNLVHGLHRFDDEQRLAFLDGRAELDEGARARSGGHVGGADHRSAD